MSFLVRQRPGLSGPPGPSRGGAPARAASAPPCNSAAREARV